jgi:L-asparaginase / beta-aspartyl-peptidase
MIPWLRLWLDSNGGRNVTDLNANFNVFAGVSLWYKVKAQADWLQLPVLVASIQFCGLGPAKADAGGSSQLNAQQLQPVHPSAEGTFGIVVHGGVNGGVAGPNVPAYCALDQYTYEQGEELKTVLRDAVNEGYRLLHEGKAAEMAVVTAIRLLEDSPLFDAGRGSFVVRRSDGVVAVEMDAAIMDGESKAVGAVGAVSRLKNPIRGAQVLMDRNREDITRDVLLFGTEAENYLRGLDDGLEFAQFEYFNQRPECDPTDIFDPSKHINISVLNAVNHETVGAVALDRNGRLVAGTSTGGLPGKNPGRIGDSPIVGAGIYADTNVALASSGLGEQFIRHSITHTIAKRVDFLGEPLSVAAARTFDEAYRFDGLNNVDIDATCLARQPDGEGCHGGALLACKELCSIQRKYGRALGIGGVIGIDIEGNVLDYFRFQAFARAHRTSVDPNPVVRIDGSIDRIRIRVSP